MIEVLATRGSHESLDEWILPRRVRGRDHVLHPYRRRDGPEAVERVIAIVDQIVRRPAPRKGLAQLLVRAAVGCVVTVMCLMRRRSWAISTRTNTSQ